MIFAQVWPVLLKLWARNPLLEHLCSLWMFVKLTIHGKEIIVMQIKKKTRKILIFSQLTRLTLLTIFLANEVTIFRMQYQVLSEETSALI